MYVAMILITLAATGITLAKIKVVEAIEVRLSACIHGNLEYQIVCLKKVLKPPRLAQTRPPLWRWRPPVNVLEYTLLPIDGANKVMNII